MGGPNSCKSADVPAAFSVPGLRYESFEALKEYGILKDAGKWECAVSNDPDAPRSVSFDDICSNDQDFFFPNLNRGFKDAAGVGHGYDTSDSTGEGEAQKKVYTALNGLGASKWFADTTYYFGAMRGVSNSSEYGAKMGAELKASTGYRWDGMLELIETIGTNILPFKTLNVALNSPTKTDFDDVVRAAWNFNQANVDNLYSSVRYVRAVEKLEDDLRAFTSSSMDLDAFESSRARILEDLEQVEQAYLSVVARASLSQDGMGATIENFRERIENMSSTSGVRGQVDGRALQNRVDIMKEFSAICIEKVKEAKTDIAAVKGSLTTAQNYLEGNDAITPKIGASGTVLVQMDPEQEHIMKALHRMLDLFEGGLDRFEGIQCEKPWEEAKGKQCVATDTSCARIGAVLEEGACVCVAPKVMTGSGNDKNCAFTKESCFAAKKGWDAGTSTCIDCNPQTQKFKTNVGCVNKQTQPPDAGTSRTQRNNPPPLPEQEDSADDTPPPPPQPEDCGDRPPKPTASERFSSDSADKAKVKKFNAYMKCKRNNR